jgi:hypothetical protein
VGFDEVAADQLRASVQVAAFSKHMTDEFAHPAILDRVLALEVAAYNGSLRCIEQFLNWKRLHEQIADSQPQGLDGVAAGGFLGEEDDRPRLRMVDVRCVAGRPVFKSIT